MIHRIIATNSSFKKQYPIDIPNPTMGTTQYVLRSLFIIIQRLN